MTSSSDEVTQLLLAWNNGDKAALEKLIPLVEDDLRRQARKLLRRQPTEHELETTALVNETYLRLVKVSQVNWESREHFLAVATHVMHRILLNYARDNLRTKRGGNIEHIPLTSTLIIPTENQPAELLALDEALNRLAEFDERKSRVVELRYFGGFTVEETAEALGVSIATVKRDWRIAKAWLRRELEREELTESDASLHVEQFQVARAAEETENPLAEAWSNRELVATLMDENWAGLKLLVQLRSSPHAGAVEIAFFLGIHTNRVASLLRKLLSSGALEERHNIFTLTNRGDTLLKNFEEAIGQNFNE